MPKSPLFSLHHIATFKDGQASLFDDRAAEEADLWFLPADQGDAAADMFAPLPHRDPRQLFDPEEWRRAQGDLSAELAALTLRLGALDERLGTMEKGVRQRLAIREAAEMSWWAGSRIGVERLTLWVGMYAGGSLDDSLALAQAGWAVRRLTAGQGPDAGGWLAGLAPFLGHAHGTQSHAIEEAAEVMAAAQHLHPVTQAAVLFHAWRIVGQGPAGDIEAAVMAACHGASMGARGAPFLPLAMSGVKALQASGSAHARLADWIGGAEQATLSALMQVQRLGVWQNAARQALSDLSGRTPALLVDLLAAWPMVTAPMAETQTGASRAAVQRNLERLQARGLIREVTGQKKYRVWTART